MTNKLFQNLLPASLVAISLTTLILKIYALNKQLSEAERMQCAFCQLLAFLSYCSFWFQSHLLIITTASLLGNLSPSHIPLFQMSPH